MRKTTDSGRQLDGHTEPGIPDHVPGVCTQGADTRPTFMPFDENWREKLGILVTPWPGDIWHWGPDNDRVEVLNVTCLRILARPAGGVARWYSWATWSERARARIGMAAVPYDGP